jgi:hypothetical protein
VSKCKITPSLSFPVGDCVAMIRGIREKSACASENGDATQ